MESGASLEEREGSVVAVKLVDGTQLEDCELVSAGGPGSTICVRVDGLDVFLPGSRIVDISPAFADPRHPSSAA